MAYILSTIRPVPIMPKACFDYTSTQYTLDNVCPSWDSWYGSSLCVNRWPEADDAGDYSHVSNGCSAAMAVAWA